MVLWLAATINFALPHLAPGDPVRYLYAGDVNGLTGAQLDRIRETTTLQNKCYRLAADLDMSGRTYPDAVISTFHGVFDGHGHTIANLTIANHKHGGLFGTLSRTARIENLGLESVTIAGTEFAKRIGMLAGENHGQIKSCYAQGEVTGRRDMGGLVGHHLYVARR